MTEWIRNNIYSIRKLLIRRPQWIDRKTIIFDPLSREDLRGIIEIQLRELARMLVDKRVEIEVSDDAKSRLVDLGYEPAFGARPLKRVILKNLQDPLAEAAIPALSEIEGDEGLGDLVRDALEKISGEDGLGQIKKLSPLL